MKTNIEEIIGVYDRLDLGVELAGGADTNYGEFGYQEWEFKDGHRVL